MSVAVVLSMSAEKMTRKVVADSNSALVTDGEPGNAQVGQVCAAEPEGAPFQLVVSWIKAFNWAMLPFMDPVYMALAVFTPVPPLVRACWIDVVALVKPLGSMELLPEQTVFAVNHWFELRAVMWVGLVLLPV